MYGGSFYQFKHFLPRLGITGRFVTSTDPQDFAAQVDEHTRGIFVESIANPTLDLFDLPALAEVAHKAGVPLIVDNTFGAAGYLIRPADLVRPRARPSPAPLPPPSTSAAPLPPVGPLPRLVLPIPRAPLDRSTSSSSPLHADALPSLQGADIILHSATKWIGGHGAALGGLVVDVGNFDWASNPRFPEFSQPFPGYQCVLLPSLALCSMHTDALSCCSGMILTKVRRRLVPPRGLRLTHEPRARSSSAAPPSPPR